MQNCKTCIIRSKAVNTLNPKELNILMGSCAETTFSPRESIMKEGILSSHIAYLKSGLAMVSKKGSKGIDQVLKIVEPGNYVGLQTVLFEKVNQFSVMALEKSVVCFMDNQSFKELIKRNTEFANELLSFVCREELNYFERFVNTHQQNINGRMADLILHFSEKIYQSNNIEIPLTRGDMAALICSTRESVARSIRDFTQEGIIKVIGKQFNILKPEKLTEISKE
ncbi:MAG: Crp/Fnr family transcriptional regulator [Bacteroidales bacterium]|nr:Crp/Fnr family transcriptional regulator [Bacteroidales bacterium]